MITGRIDEALAAASRSLDEAPPDARRTRSIAANIRGGTLAHEGRIDEGLADFERARVEAGDDRDALLRYYVNMSDTLQLLGRFEASLDVAGQGFELARSAGVERTSGAILAVNTVDPLFALGEWDRADELIESSLELNPPAVFRVYLRRAKMRSTLWRGDPQRRARPVRALGGAGAAARRVRGPDPRRPRPRPRRRASRPGRPARRLAAGAAPHRAPPARVPGWNLPLAAAAARTIARVREADNDPTALRRRGGAAARPRRRARAGRPSRSGRPSSTPSSPATTAPATDVDAWLAARARGVGAGGRGAHAPPDRARPRPRTGARRRPRRRVRDAR